MTVPSVVEWVNSVGRRLRNPENREGTMSITGTHQNASRTSLFHCPDCETVYIATDKTTCSTCDTTVDRVPSTLVETV